MLPCSDHPYFFKLVEDAVALDLGGVLSDKDAMLIHEVAEATLAPNPKDIAGFSLEIAKLQTDPLHRPEDFHSLEIIKATKRHCWELLRKAA